MKLPFVRRSELENVEAALEESERTAYAAIEGEATAIKRATRAETILETTFGLTAEPDFARSDIIEYRLHLSSRVLTHSHLQPRELVANRLHDALDEMIERGRPDTFRTPTP